MVVWVGRKLVAVLRLLLTPLLLSYPRFGVGPLFLCARFGVGPLFLCARFGLGPLFFCARFGLGPLFLCARFGLGLFLDLD